jgi:trimeric autotransporter adhesin
MSLCPSMPGRIRSCIQAVAIASLGFAPPALAIEPPKENPAQQQLLDLGFQNPALEVAPSLSTFSGESLADVAQAEKAAANQDSVKGLQRLMGLSSSDWEVRWDDRSDRPHLVQGAGLALLPGAGNRLRADEAGLADAAGVERAPAMADVERLLRGFMTDYTDLLRVDPASLRLDTSRSVTVGNGRSWFIEFQQVHNGVPVEGANVYFRINNGNLVQFGADRVGDIGNLSTKPGIKSSVALDRVLKRLGFARADVREIVNAGTLKIYPTLVAGEAPAEKFQGTRGKGYGHVLAWELTFRRTGSESTYHAVVDARTGALLQLRDLTVYATVTGGIYPVTNTDPEEVRPLPFANVTNGTAKITDAAGNYTYSGGTATSTLNGRYIRMSDNCGAISLSNSTTGNLAFGTSGGTDCTTPGFGGAGNTHATRSGFYHLTNINRKAASFLTGNSWLNGTLQANMNINNTCNAFWNGSTVNFYRSGGGCSNTGELAAVFLHEWGHGMDTNSGGAASENASGEAAGDTFAFLETRDSCIGDNFRPGVNCANCDSCTGVRDVEEFSLSGNHTIARPSTIADNNGINCDRYACPYLQQGIFPYQGPMGYQGHCESHIASGANWDLAQSLVATHGTTAGWAAMDSLWYESLTPSKSAYQVVSGGKCNPSAVVNGCGSSNWYTVYLAADDDDGNLANGTPNGCRIWDAFNAHGIACGTRPACSGGCTPTATANAGPDRSIGAGGSTTIGTPALAGHTYSWSPGGQTAAEITVSPASTTTYTVTATTACGSANDSVTVTVTVADTTPPSTSITSPANGATVSGTVTVTASASDNVGVTRVEFLVDGALAATDTTSPYSFAWNTSALVPGSTHTLASRAFDAANNQGNSTNVTVTIGSALTAVYDSVLRAPKCAAVGVSCDSGATLLNGRDGKGPEPNQPNTINASCADGTSGTYHSDESNDRLKVSTVDGTSLQAGKQVRIDATVWAWSSYTTDKLDLYYAANANSPSWTFIGTFTPPGSGARTMSATYTLPAGGLQAIRAQFRYQGVAGTCSSGGYNDRDDLIFAVSP